MTDSQPSLAVVCHLLNEAEGLPSFHEALVGVLEALPHGWRIIFVDDGSTDQSCQLIEGFRDRDPRTGLVRLTRNVGKKSALLVSLDYCDANLVATIDADGQYPPADLPRLLEQFVDGDDVAFTVRTDRSGEAPMKNLGARGFCGLMDCIGRVDMPRNASDFRVVHRPVVEAFRSRARRTVLTGRSSPRWGSKSRRTL